PEGAARGNDRAGRDPHAPRARARSHAGAARYRAAESRARNTGVHPHRGAAGMTPSGAWGGLIAHYRDRLPIERDDRIVSLNDGNTPLARADRLAAAVAPGVEIYPKCQGQNPTASF